MKALAVIIPAAFVLALLAFALVFYGVSSGAEVPFVTVNDVDAYVVDVEIVAPGCGAPQEAAAIATLEKDGVEWVLLLYKGSEDAMKFMLVSEEVTYAGHLEGPGDGTDRFIIQEVLSRAELERKYTSPCNFFFPQTT